MQRFVHAMFNGPIWRTFLLMGVFAGVSAIASYNLLLLFIANFSFISQYGVMALRDGGFVQLAELILYGYLSIGFYILFKGCLYGVLGRFVKRAERAADVQLSFFRGPMCYAGENAEKTTPRRGGTHNTIVKALS